MAFGASSSTRRRLVAARRTACNLASQAARQAAGEPLASPTMSSHRSRRAAGAVDPRAAGRRRIVGATTVSAVGGTALAVFFGSLFAQAFAAESAPKPAPVQAALTLP